MTAFKDLSDNERAMGQLIMALCKDIRIMSARRIPAMLHALADEFQRSMDSNPDVVCHCHECTKERMASKAKDN